MSFREVSILILLFIIMMMIAAIGCNTPESIQTNYLPNGAANVIDKGNGWYEFELEGNKFMYFKHGAGDMSTAGVTQVK